MNNAWRLPIVPVLLAALAACLPTSAGAQDMDVPVSVQVPLFHKILTFDRRLSGQPGREIVIAILYQRGYRVSSLVCEEIEAAARGLDPTVAGRPVRWLPLELGEARDLTGELDRMAADVLYVTPLRGAGLAEITAAARSRQTLTLTGVGRYVEEGLSVGIGLERDRPQIRINLETARAEGADFTSQLLKLATLVGAGR